MMKKLLLCLWAALAASAVLAQTLPDVKVENGRGKMVDIRSLANGKPAIISFWSLTCKPCIQELNAINDNLEDWLADVAFDVIAVSVDDVRQKARAKAKADASGWEFICVYDGNQDLKRAMNVSNTPHSFVVDARGNIVFSHVGYTPGSEQLLLDAVKNCAQP